MPDDKQNYERIGPDHWHYARVEALKRLGHVTCDAIGHNDEGGCPNPSCWKHPNDKHPADPQETPTS